MDVIGKVIVMTGAAAGAGKVIALTLGGGPHILVNNAGGWGTAGRRFPEASPAEWSAVLDLNLRAPMTLTQRFLAPMTDAGAGAVVNIASSAGRGNGPYASS